MMIVFCWVMPFLLTALVVLLWLVGEKESEIMRLNDVYSECVVD